MVFFFLYDRESPSSAVLQTQLAASTETHSAVLRVVRSKAARTQSFLTPAAL